MLNMLITGGHGQLGRDVARAAQSVGIWRIAVRAPGSTELDITDPDAITAAVSKLATEADVSGRTPLVLNTAAYTAVDEAEAQQQRAFAVNMDAPGRLSSICAALDVPLVHVSTNYVFSGTANRPYESDDTIGPLSVYGRSKAAGEEALLREGKRSWVVRAAWLYGRGGDNFVETMLRLERERDHVSVVADQHGSPTWTADFARGLLQLAQLIAEGQEPRERILHCTAAGETTWYGLACAIFEELGADSARVKPCTTAEFPRPATRPSYSVLSNASWHAAGLTPLRHWRDALRDYLAGLAATDKHLGPEAHAVDP